LSDVILDIVESGRTLRENGLVVLDDICDISARLIVNRVSLKTRGGRIKPLIEAMGAALDEGKR
jgi:ATP phosphoribosyltransferase